MKNIVHVPIQDIIAERHLSFVSKTGETYSCRLLFGKPYKIEDGRYRCDYQILGGIKDYTTKDFGNDSLDALLWAITRANIVLAHRFDGKFYYEGSEDLYLIIKDYSNA